jgi:hypothetical protein
VVDLFQMGLPGCLGLSSNSIHAYCTTALRKFPPLSVHYSPYGISGSTKGSQGTRVLILFSSLCCKMRALVISFYPRVIITILKIRKLRSGSLNDFP